MEIETITTDDTTRYRLSGDLTFATIREVHDAVCSLGSDSAIIVDLNEIGAIDLTALQWVVACGSRVTFEGDKALSRFAKMARYVGVDMDQAVRSDG